MSPVIDDKCRSGGQGSFLTPTQRAPGFGCINYNEVKKFGFDHFCFKISFGHLSATLLGKMSEGQVPEDVFGLFRFAAVSFCKVLFEGKGGGKFTAKI